MMLANRLPELKKKEIKYQILNQIIDFTVNYFNTSSIQQFDPEFYISIHDYIQNYFNIKNEPDFTFDDKIDSIKKTITQISIKTRSRLFHIKQYL